MITHLYISGPISHGHQFHNVRNAILVADRMRKIGYVPFIPHLYVLMDMIAPFTYDEIMLQDIEWLNRCDALLRLPGLSPGSEREVTAMLDLKRPVFWTETDAMSFMDTQLASKKVVRG